MRKLIARFLLIGAFLPLHFLPRSVMAQTVTANSCSLTDVKSAWAKVTASTTLFIIPGGTCDWSAGIGFSAPAGSTTITIQGQGSTTGSDGFGNPTGYNDQTNLQINSGTASIVNFSGSAAQTLFRVTGLTIQILSGTSGCSTVFGGGQNTPAPTPFLRVDHNHFTTTQNGICQIQTFGAAWGVVDHNVITQPISTSSAQSVTNFWRVGAGWTGDGFASGGYTWNQPTGWGTNQFLFFENNFFTGGYINDCSSGGKQVFRYNTIVHAIEQGHEGTGDFRGCRATEYYQNNVTCDANNAGVASTRNGTMLVWGNTTKGCSAQLVGLNNDRTNGHTFGKPPDWGYCGTQGVYPGPSPWDGNSNSAGYPCVDQPGRGQSDYIFGSAYGFGEPMRANVTLKMCPTSSTTGSGGALTCPAGYVIGNTSPGGGSWPRNALEPVYEWMDAAQGQVGGDCNPLNCLPNRDYYQESIGQAAQSSPTSPFNGSAGTGHGTLSNRPTTCTAGPGGQFAAGPPRIGGSPGVAYWATDENTLYVCTATNTWSLYYEPYTHPHPLIAGGTSGNAPAPPTNISATVH